MTGQNEINQIWFYAGYIADTSNSFQHVCSTGC